MSVGAKESNPKLTTHNRGECKAQDRVGNNEGINKTEPQQRVHVT